ncbi:hypothetical protein PF002_g24067 [Phytophthora fragariae]|uniref:Uncharacterized protein n=2 Tax=Phytophthora fragariae TaxID=53985 RepID=A0A6A3E1F3_9STRA|nr:hypothetical protein PF009_g26135 [Phytophthora fragariae]KAE9147627.1 hypothetical protein PF006_g7712 [Phytophthora fragariae]KAE9192880.1 hypothetical protein PF002_g24067 [Phytophthora fragariae]
MEWEFLRPWGRVLSDSVDMQYTPCMRPTDPKVLVKVEWTCWLSSESKDLSRWECRNLLTLFEVRIPARESDQQLVREAMEIFTMLAAVNNEVFKKLVAQYMGQSRFADDPHVVFPRWLCKLVGEVPSDDPVMTQGSVTWGEIFGFSRGPREFSLGFRNAMEKLEAMGLEGSRYLCASARWEVESNAFLRTIETSGRQHVAFPPERSKVVPTAEEFSRHFGKFFSFTAAPAAQLCAVGDADKLTEAWKRQPQQLPDESVVNTVDRMSSSFMDLELRGRLNVHQVIAALVRSGLTHQTLHLASAGRQIGFEAMQNFGFFIAALLRQNPLCTPSRGDHSFSSQENDYCRDLKVLFDCSLDIRMTGICSAVAGSPQLEKLSIGRWINRNYPGVERMRHCYWGWLGFALSNDSIEQLKITGVDLGQRGVALFEAALKHKYPEPVLSTLSSPQYGYIKVRAGTMLNSRGWGDADRTSFALLHDCRCRALFDPFTTKSEENVVVPGHGICSLKLTDQASGFVPDRVAKSSTVSGSSSRLQSLKLNIATCQSALI